MSDILIFITATIHCGDTPHVKRTDPEQRTQDYLTAFRKWLSLEADADIVFCENSNADLARFREVALQHKGRNKVRILTFAGNVGAQLKGKGYGEIEMLQHALNTVPGMKDYRYIVKVSGRYVEFNGEKLVRLIAGMSSDLICDIHSNLTYGDTRTVAFTPKVLLEHLIPYQEELDENRGIIIEHLMAKCLHRTLIAGGTWSPLPCTPYSDGISGSWNIPQRASLLYRFKQDVKRAIAKWIYRY